MRDSSRMRWLLVRAICGSLVLTLFLAGCERGTTPTSTPAISTIDETAQSAIEAGRLPVLGTILPAQRVKLSFGVGGPVEVVNVRLRAVGAVTPPPLPQAELASPDPSAAFEGRRPVVIGTGLTQVPFYLGKRLRPGNAVTGPAIIAQPDTTVFLGPGDEATVDGRYNLVIEVNTFAISMS